MSTNSVMARLSSAYSDIVACGFRVVITAGLILCTAGAAQAAIIFDNAGTSFSMSANDQGLSQQQDGDDFTFASPVVLKDVHWRGGYRFNNISFPQDDFTIRIFNVVGGVPETSPSVLELNVGNVTRALTGDVLFGQVEYAYSVVIPDLALAAGTYALGIVNNRRTGSNIDFWNWSVQLAPVDSAPGSLFRTSDSGTWINDNTNMVFFLTGDAMGIPEPGTLALFGLGLAGLGFARRRKAA